MSGSSTRMMLLLLVCIGLLSSDNRYHVSALRNKEFFLRKIQAAAYPSEIAKLRSIHRHNREDQVMLSGSRRFLEEVSKNKIQHGKTQQEQNNMTKNSFESSKRQVRRGSDPIHNKSEPFS